MGAPLRQSRARFRRQAGFRPDPEPSSPLASLAYRLHVFLGERHAVYRYDARARMRRNELIGGPALKKMPIDQGQSIGRFKKSLRDNDPSQE
jgi:hypothetical protein